MKILHVYKDFDPPVHGGIEKHMALMCRFQREHAQVSALTCSRSVRTRRVMRDGTDVLEVGELCRLQNSPLSPTFPLYLRRAHADVYVLHFPHPTAEVAWLTARPRGALVVRYHSDVVRQAAALKVYRPVLMQFLAQADMILPTSQQYVETSPVLSAFADKCRVVPLGITIEDYATPDSGQVDALHARYGGRFVFFAGRHRYYKGLAYLVEAAARVDAPVVIGGDGPERARLEALNAAKKAGVHFTGRLSEADLIAHLQACSVFAFPSIARSEAFGMALLEAHACGKPAVATQLGTGVEFVNQHERTGLNVPPRDAVALADAINELLNDPARAAAMGAYARERVRREFDARHVAEQELACYR
ncbi:MAG: glycosyltransferase, partial [Candidatus Hydrogenedentales bacterium]